MILVRDRDDVIKHHHYLEEYEHSVYIPMFPFIEEREPFENILQRIGTDSCPMTTISLKINDGRVIGGCISDYYPHIECVNPIYLSVLPEKQKKGLGRELLDFSISQFEKRKHVFIEVDNPERVIGRNNVMNPSERVLVYEKLGFSLVPFRYVQPPLSEGMSPSFDLMLMHRGDSLTYKILMDYLTAFYECLDAGDSVYLDMMKKEISGLTF